MQCESEHLFVCVFLQGVEEGADGLKLISDVIVEKLGITMSVLMGANIANEVADEKFCETTIGSSGHRVTRLFMLLPVNKSLTNS